MKSSKRQRDRQIGLRLTELEFDTIALRARQAGYQRSTEYLRDAGLKGVRVERRDLGRAIGELGRIGNNLNQLARQANAGGDPGAEVIEAALAELRDVAATLIADR